jgi:hypothetical protein
VSDVNNDQKPDLVLGNLGWNSRFRPTIENPVCLYISDFDRNGSVDPIYTYRKGMKDYPYSLRQDILKQMPQLKKKFLYFKDYAGKSIDEIFSSDQLKKSELLQFRYPSTSVALNGGNFEFNIKPLAWQAQVSPVSSIVCEDVNKDGSLDLILGGNFFGVKPEVGRYDALKGLLLLGDGLGNFSAVNSQQSGLNVEGETRNIKIVKTRNGKKVVFARNNDSLKIFDLWK